MAISLSEEENLVGQNPRDKALLKVMEIQKSPDAVTTKYWLLIYTKAFITLAKNFYGLNVDLIKANFDQETIRGLEDLVMQKAKKWSFATQVFMYCVPLIGWLGILVNKYPYADEMFWNFSYRLLRSRKKLKKLGVDPISQLIQSWKIEEKKK